MPGLGEQNYYEFRFAKSHFIVMNTHDTGLLPVGTWLTDEQKEFVQTSLAQAGADPQVRHIFLVGHHSPYSSSNHGSSLVVQDFVEGLAGLDRVDFFFAAHDHNYERWESPVSGLKGFVSGGGGAGLYGQDDPGAAFSKYFYRGYHYLLVEVAGGFVRVCPKNPDGTLVEPCTETGDPDPDGGVDAGTDAGFDAGTDAGFDAGTDAGFDAGEDAGFDAGTDAGKDAGPDGQLDASADQDPEDAGTHADAGVGDTHPTDDSGAGQQFAGCGCRSGNDTWPASSAMLLLLLAGLPLRRWTLRRRRHK